MPNLGRGEVEGGGEEGGGEEGEEEKPEPLTEKQMVEVPVAIEVFGMDMVSWWAGLGRDFAVA